jgi:hypothetical protein
MSETESKWPLPFARQFFVDAMGGVWKGAKRLPSHGLQQAQANIMLDLGPKRERTLRRRMRERLAMLKAAQDGTLVPWVLPPRDVERDGKPVSLLDAERLRQAKDHRERWEAWQRSAAKARAESRNPGSAPRQPPTRARMLPSLEPYPAVGDLTTGWVVLELEDRTRVLLHGPSVAALAPDFSVWQ